MNKNNLLIIIIVLLFAAAGFFFVSNQNNNTEQDGSQAGTTMMDDNSDKAMDDSMMKDDSDKAMDDSMMKDDSGEAMDDSMMKDDSGEAMDDSMMKDDSGETMQKTDTDQETSQNTDAEVMTAGTYEPYAAQKLANAENGDVVLFFHASWCPSCRSLNSNIEANTSNIPNGLTILKTDYDTQTELKKKYGVTTQHTFVQVDSEGNMIKKWSGSLKLENLVSEVQ